MKVGLPPIIAPIRTSPGAKKETVPDSSTPARSNGAAIQVGVAVLTTLPDASFVTAVNFTFWPTERSGDTGVISTVFTAVLFETCAVETEVTKPAVTVSKKMTSKLANMRINKSPVIC
jgi:hypothetical protein